MPAAPKTAAKGWSRARVGVVAWAAIGWLAGAEVRADPCGPNHVDRYDPLTDRADCIPYSTSLQLREQLFQEQKSRLRQQSAFPTRLQREQETLTRQLRAEQRQISTGRRSGEREVEQQRETEGRLLDQNQKLLNDEIRRQKKPAL